MKIVMIVENTNKLNELFEIANNLPNAGGSEEPEFCEVTLLSISGDFDVYCVTYEGIEGTTSQYIDNVTTVSIQCKKNSPIHLSKAMYIDTGKGWYETTFSPTYAEYVPFEGVSFFHSVIISGSQEGAGCIFMVHGNGSIEF